MSKKPTFGICAPSSYANKDRFESGLEKLRALGHNVVVHPQTYARLGETQSAGTDQEKLNALYDLLDHQDVDVILFSGGGNFAVHLLDKIDYARFKKNPKPIMGFSDATFLMNAIHHMTGNVTYHGPMVGTFSSEFFNAPEYYDQMVSLLNGTLVDITLNEAQIIKNGHTKGRLIGGNLECFRALIGTKYMPDVTGSIIFLEDLGLELNHFDRTLASMRLAGVFERAHGVVFGQFSDMKDIGRPFGYTVKEIIERNLSGVTSPVVMNAPFGHIGMFPTFPVGAVVTLDARQGTPVIRLEK